MIAAVGVIYTSVYAAGFIDTAQSHGCWLLKQEVRPGKSGSLLIDPDTAICHHLLC